MPLMLISTTIFACKNSIGTVRQKTVV